MPKPALSVVGRVVPLVAALNQMGYMFRRPYVMDSTRSQQTSDSRLHRGRRSAAAPPKGIADPARHAHSGSRRIGP